MKVAVFWCHFRETFLTSSGKRPRCSGTSSRIKPWLPFRDLQVKNIVDKAVKEMGIERVMEEMQQTWGEVQAKFEHHHTGTPLLETDEELIESLEEHEVHYPIGFRAFTPHI